MGRFTPIQQSKPHVKVLATGGSNVGKTHGGLELPGRKAGFDGEDGLVAFSNRFQIDRLPVHTIDNLVDEVNILLNDRSPEGDLAQYDTFLIDGTTVWWQDAMRRIEEAKNNGQGGDLEFRDQRNLKDPWKELMHQVMKLGLAEKNVYATAQAKNDWKIEGRKVEMQGKKADVEAHLFFAFDIVFQLDLINDIRTATILKSRYDLFQMGDVIDNFSVKEHFAPIFSGKSKIVTGNVVQDEQLAAMREIALRLKSEAKGGIIPKALASRVGTLLSLGKGALYEEVEVALGELKRIDASRQQDEVPA